jgi:anti-sigma regulatory factor (Ser/Thr protein kinase)
MPREKTSPTTGTAVVPTEDLPWLPSLATDQPRTEGIGEANIAGPHDTLFELAHFAPTPESVPLARHRIAAFLAQSGCPREISADATLIVSELATNAIRHVTASSGFSLCVTLGPVGIRIECVDPAWNNKPHVERPSEDSQFGRGMQLIALLASAWGVRSNEDARQKTVWALLEVSDASR